ncbi:flagellin [Maridesulfovibrio sp.]|uniref:flagellin n=1 Tax=Maridesulfovibrio sp. TaxID=2795000 RepID=UPI0029CA119A|nr:flagellin [Maridesulfovibrio sp.]
MCFLRFCRYRVWSLVYKLVSDRSNLGATQNRLENTITNLSIQAENLQASESRISDVDVATEMTEFVRRQILTQSATAMLAQANSLPKMAMQLIGG